MSWVVILVAILVAVGVALISKVKKADNHQLKEFAENFGLTINKKGAFSQPDMTGTYNGRALVIKDIVHSTGKSVYYTHKISLNSASPFASTSEIFITRMGSRSHFFANIGRFFTSNAVTFDDSEFDAAVIVKARDKSTARRLLDAEMQQEILSVKGGKFEIRHGAISYEAQGKAHDNPGPVREVLRVLNRIEERLVMLHPSAAKGSQTTYKKTSSGPVITTRDAEMTFLEEDKGKHYYGE